jgi:hypothetical protein
MRFLAVSFDPYDPHFPNGRLLVVWQDFPFDVPLVEGPGFGQNEMQV